MRVLATIFWLTSYHGEMNNVTDQMLLKYQSVAEEIDSNSIQIYTDIPEFQRLMDELTAVGVDVKIHRRLEFSPKEIDAAQFLSFHPTYEDLNPYTEEPGEFYQPSCMECKAYIHQTGNLFIRKSSLGKRNFLWSWENELVISPKVKSLFDREPLTGMEFRPVFQKRDEDPIAYQVVPTNVLPPCHKQNISESDHCSQCGFVSYEIPLDTTLRYSDDDLHDTQDFNYTAEYFGSGWFPRREIIVSQRVRHILNKVKLRGVRYEPIIIDSDFLN